MAHFYATIPTSARKTVASARGHKSTGIATKAASWAGAVRVYLWHDEETDKDHFEVNQTTHEGAGIHELLARGVIGEPAGLSEDDKAVLADALRYFAVKHSPTPEDHDTAAKLYHRFTGKTLPNVAA